MARRQRQPLAFLRQGRVKNRRRLDDPCVAWRPCESNHWMLEKYGYRRSACTLARTVGNLSVARDNRRERVWMTTLLLQCVGPFIYRTLPVGASDVRFRVAAIRRTANEVQMKSAGA